MKYKEVMAIFREADGWYEKPPGIVTELFHHYKKNIVALIFAGDVKFIEIIPGDSYREYDTNIILAHITSGNFTEEMVTDEFLDTLLVLKELS